MCERCCREVGLDCTVLLQVESEGDGKRERKRERED